MNAILPLLDDIRHKVTFDELMALVRRGFFAEPGRVELLDGVIVEMVAEGFNHVDMKSAIGDWMIRHLPESFRAIIDSTLQLSPHNAPSPDIWICSRAIPLSEVKGADVALIIEVADTSLLHDKQVKAPIYEAHGVREYWIVDLESRSILPYRRGQDGRFIEPDPGAAGAMAKALFIPGLILDLDQLRP